MAIVTLDESINKDPTFDVEQVQLQFDLNKSLQQLLVQNNVMYLVLTQSIYKIDLSNPSIVKHVEVPRADGGSGVRIVSAWLHWNGHHFIIQTNHNQYFYLHDTYKQFKILPRLKGLHLKYIAFRKKHLEEEESDYENTGDFIVGTKEGVLYVCLLKSHDIKYHESKRDDKYLKSIYSESTGTLNGLAYLDNNSVLASIDGQLLQWSLGNNSYNDIVKGFRQPPKNITTKPLSASSPTLHLLVSDGTTYIYIDSGEGNQIVSNDPEMIRQELNVEVDGKKLTPSQSVILTNHHIISLLGKQHELLAAFIKLSNKPGKLIETESSISGSNRILGITADYTSSTFWLYSVNNIYEIIINNETSSVWYNYYQMGKYDEALKCLREQQRDDSSSNGDTTSIEIKTDLVLIEQGYSFLQQGGFGIDFDGGKINKDLFNLQKKGIKILAKLSEPFEKICLMLTNVTQNSEDNTQDSTILQGHRIISERLLVEYLLVKFQVAKREKIKIRIVVLSSWIVELMLRLIYSNKGGEVKIPDEADDTSLNSMFESFLSENYKLLDPKTIYQIIAGFNYPSKLIYFAELIQDYEFILNYYIEREDWLNLLRILIKIYTLNNDDMMNVIYKNSTVLLVNSPKETIATWLKFPLMNYERVLPSILTYSKSIQERTLINENELIRFLQKIIYDKRVKSEVINNYYLSLLISYPEKEKNNSSRLIIKLLNKVHEISSTPTRSGAALYDPNFILRQCLTYEHFHPAVLILMNDMQLFEQALKLALDHGLTELGQVVLKKYDDHLFNREPENDNILGRVDIISDLEEDMRYVGKIKLEEETFSSRKKLWIMFSRYLIEGICKGEEFEFLNEIEISEVHGEKDEPNGNASSKEGKENITKSLISEMAGESDSNVLKDLPLPLVIRKLLKYLLSNSYTPQTNSNILSLKDILPLFPSTIIINNFKTEIIQSLNQYNSKISQLSHEMQESLQISAKLKKQIKESATLTERARIYTIVEPGEPCGICRDLLISKLFVCFPNCNHGFHKDCLVKYYLKLKGEYKFKKIFQNFKRIPSSQNKIELDEILLKECVLCNESNINTIDDNIIDLEREKSEADSWAL